MYIENFSVFHMMNEIIKFQTIKELRDINVKHI